MMMNVSYRTTSQLLAKQIFSENFAYPRAGIKVQLARLALAMLACSI
ncbi:hypothetical protein Pla52n_45160 [Stieleria varia]|uniref:Uncharacterized protein n=1 Tax=Stieleria varia TaxID=2528005 RepID=A0A5C6ASI1_9BACT|nr:hypothetical protein Pla52n_45160 [Stieleria varia]